MLNDGTGILLFFMFANLAHTVSVETWDLKYVFIHFFCRGAGGIILGYLIRHAFAFWLKRIVSDHVNITNVTLVAAFVCYFTAEYTRLGVSGVLALVSLGLGMG